MKISIVGLGWYGSPLAVELQKAGHTISGSTRSDEKIAQFKSQNIYAEAISCPQVPSKKLLTAEIVILNIPPFDEELDWFKSFPWDSKTWIIFISSTSTYPVPDSKSGMLLKAQEDWVQGHFEKWTILRFGGLYGAKRHPGKYLSGRKNLAGRLWPVNLVHLDDCIGVTKTVIDQNIHNKLLHVVSDDHRTKEEFYSEYCQKEGLPLPEFDLTDLSVGKTVPNDELKKIYQLKF